MSFGRQAALAPLESGNAWCSKARKAQGAWLLLCLLCQVSTWATPDYKPEQKAALPNLDDLVYIDHIHPADDTGMRWVLMGGILGPPPFLQAVIALRCTDPGKPVASESRHDAVDPLITMIAHDTDQVSGRPADRRAATRWA